MKRLFLVWIVIIACSMISARDDDRGYIVKIGQETPNIELQFLDGSKKELKDFKGKVIMLQFTAKWCGVCREEMGHIEKDIWQKYKNNPDFALFGIDFKESKETVEQFIKEVKVTYPILLDPEAKAFYSYAEKGAGVTRNVIIDRDGKIIFLTRLFDPEEFKEMVKVIDKLLKEKN
jgi:hypothetical protein